jgi:hypothetical protein
MCLQVHGAVYFQRFAGDDKRDGALKALPLLSRAMRNVLGCHLDHNKCIWFNPWSELLILTADIADTCCFDSELRPWNVPRVQTPGVRGLGSGDGTTRVKVSSCAGVRGLGSADGTTRAKVSNCAGVRGLGSGDGTTRAKVSSCAGVRELGSGDGTTRAKVSNYAGVG